MKHLFCCIALLLILTLGGSAAAQTTIEFDVSSNDQVALNVVFHTTSATPVIECWQLTPTSDLLKAFSTCSLLPYDGGKLEVLASGATSTNLSMPLTKVAFPTHFSVAPYAVKGCSATGVHAPKIVVLIGTPTNGTYRYFVDYGSGQDAVITIQVGAGIGSEGNQGSGPTNHGKGGCCCCGDRSDLSFPSNSSDGSKGRIHDESGVLQFDPVPYMPGYYPQEQSNWCWAAVNQTLLQGTSVGNWQQCAQAKTLFLNELPSLVASIDCGASTLNRGVEDYRDALRSLRYTCRARRAAPRTQSAWIVRWNGGGRHAMVLDTVRNGLAYGFDPWPVNEGGYFIMSKNDLAANDLFTTETYYNSIHRIP